MLNSARKHGLVGAASVQHQKKSCAVAMRLVRSKQSVILYSTCKVNKAMEIDTIPEANTADVVFRPIHCKLNTHTRTDGSALLTQGTTGECYHICLILFDRQD